MKTYKSYVKTAMNGFLNENLMNHDILKEILRVFKNNTMYSSEIYPTKRYAFVIDKPSANTIYFRTKYFGDWKDNIQVSFSFGDDFFRVSNGDDRFKSFDINALDKMLVNLHDSKVKKYGSYLTNEYSTDLVIQNTMVDILD